MAKKTEHRGGEHAARVVPSRPELRAILADAVDRAEPGATLIVPVAAADSAAIVVGVLLRKEEPQSCDAKCDSARVRIR